MSFTVALARASRAKGLFHLSLLVAGSWSAGIAVFFFEVATKSEYPFAFPAIDGVAAGLIMMLATRPNYPGRAPLVFVAVLLLVQALFRTVVTGYGYYNPEAELNIPYVVMFGVNRLFEVILISIWVISAFRIIRFHQPELHEILWRVAGVLPNSDRPSKDIRYASRDEFDRHIGARLAEARRRRGWSAERLASESTLAADEIEQFENGGRRVPPSILQELCRLLGVKMSFFTDGLETTS